MCASHANPHVAKAEFQSEYKGTKSAGLRTRDGGMDSPGVKSSRLVGVQDWFDILQGRVDVSMFPSRDTVTLMFDIARSSSLELSVQQAQNKKIPNYHLCQQFNCSNFKYMTGFLAGNCRDHADTIKEGGEHAISVSCGQACYPCYFSV